MKTKQDDIEYVARKVGFKSLHRYKARMDFIFKNAGLANKRILDVGCGKGAISLWAAVHGADYVLGIEPEADGSTQGAIQTFTHLIESLGLKGSVEARDILIQNLQIEIPFDIVILFNTINHLDENAVSHLHENVEAFERYLSVADCLRGLLKKDGLLILADCGRKNFWNRIGIRPSARTIEWQKHQEPEIWISLMEKSGFRLEDLRWSSLYPFYSLTANRIVQYLTTSHFVLRFRAV